VKTAAQEMRNLLETSSAEEKASRDERIAAAISQSQQYTDAFR